MKPSPWCCVEPEIVRVWCSYVRTYARSHTGVACTAGYCGVKIALLPLPAAAAAARQQLIVASLSLIVEISWSYCCSFPCEKSQSFFGVSDACYYQ